MKALAIISIFVLGGFYSSAQQEYSFTQFADVNAHLNPAAVGTEGVQKITGMFRTQWVGFGGAPFNGGIMYENELTEYNMGIGGYIFSDAIGASNIINAAVNYGYRLKLNDKQQLAFGLNIGADFIHTDYDRLKYWDEEDAVFNTRQSHVLPKAGAGIYFFSEKYYVGVSAPRLVAYNDPNFPSIDRPGVPSMVTHYYLMGGYTFDLKNDFMLKTNTQLKYTPAVMPQADFLVLCEYDQTIGLGVGYRTLGFASAILQYTYDRRVVVGYAFDMTLSKMANYSYGSHELLVRYNLPQKRK